MTGMRPHSEPPRGDPARPPSLVSGEAGGFVTFASLPPDAATLFVAVFAPGRSTRGDELGSPSRIRHDPVGGVDLPVVARQSMTRLSTARLAAVLPRR